METTMASLMCSHKNSTTAKYNRPLLDIEKNFDRCGVFTWQTDNWTICFPLIGVYLIAVFAGKKYMESRLPFKLRGILLFWNIILALFSIIASWRMITAAIHDIQTYGLLDTLCTNDSIERRQAVGIWIFLYDLSKFLEFGDTIFIVLRKTPLSLLHVYHHVTVAFMVWSTAAYASPLQCYFGTINLAVHSIMYSYYALKVIGMKIPKTISMAITSLQLVQMVMGIALTAYVYYKKISGHACYLPDQAVAIAATIYFSYFVLFLDFFIKAYIIKRKQPATTNVQLKKVD